MALSSTSSRPGEARRTPRRSTAGKLTARQIQVRERERIGQELHDGLCQSLLGVSFELRALARIATMERSDLAPALERVVEMLNEAMHETREVARGCLPAEMQGEAGLLGTLQRLAERTSSKVACEFRTPLAAWLVTREKALQIYRLTQEAIANAVRHSGARQIVVSLEPAQDRIWLRVEDNGRGFSANAPEPCGLGLRIMKRRAALLGGELEIITRAGVGTSISCGVPKSPNL